MFATPPTEYRIENKCLKLESVLSSCILYDTLANKSLCAFYMATFVQAIIQVNSRIDDFSLISTTNAINSERETDKKESDYIVTITSQSGNPFLLS